MNQNQTQPELDKINQAIAAQEALRGVLPDDELEAILRPLRQKRAELAGRLSPATYQATLHGSGAIAQGEGATAAGERGVLVTGNVAGPIITGSGNTVYSGATAADPVALPRHLAPLRDQLARLFDKSELNGLCFDLGIAADDLPGETRTALAQALVAHCYRQERLAELLAYGRNLRPHATWSIEHE
jgi:hypothetical protein